MDVWHRESVAVPEFEASTRQRTIALAGAHGVPPKGSGLPGRVWASGEPAWIGRMAELGIRSGCRLQVLQPGSPCLLSVGGCRLSLRGECACQVFVRPLAQSAE